MITIRPRSASPFAARLGSIALLLMSATIANAQPPAAEKRPGADRFGPPRASADDRREHRDEARQLSAEEFEIAARMLENFFGAEAADRLRAAAEADPAAASATIRRDYPRLARFLEFRRRDPMAELRWDEVRLAGAAQRLAREHREAVANDRPELAQRVGEELRETIALQLDVRTELREQELAQLERRLDQLREELAQQTGRRDQLIDERFAALTTGDDLPKRPMPLGPPPASRNAAPATQPAD